MNTQLELVRVAASTRSFLVSWRVYVAYAVTVTVVDALTPGSLRASGAIPSIVVILGLVALWWFNRRNAIWIERDAAGIRVLTRRFCRWEDLADGRMRATGELVAEFPVKASVSYDPTSIAWWRADTSLTIDGQRFAVHPEGRDLAKTMADQTRWQFNRL